MHFRVVLSLFLSVAVPVVSFAQAPGDFIHPFTTISVCVVGRPAFHPAEMISPTWSLASGFVRTICPSGRRPFRR